MASENSESSRGEGGPAHVPGDSGHDISMRKKQKVRLWSSCKQDTPFAFHYRYTTLLAFQLVHFSAAVINNSNLVANVKTHFNLSS